MQNITPELYKKLKILYESKRYKYITDLYSIHIKVEKNANKIVLYKIRNSNTIKFYIKAIVWKNNNYLDFKYYICETDINKNSKINTNDIKRFLLCEIYKKVIKNNIMMI